MRKIVYERADGTVVIVMPPAIHRFSTDAEAERNAFVKLPPDAINPRFVENDSIPTDRTFRNAWIANGKGVTVDMTRAKDVCRCQLRTVRAPVLASLDVAYQRADEANDQKAKSAIATQKQTLRDITDHPSIDAAKTPDELKSVLAALNETIRK